MEYFPLGAYESLAGLRVSPSPDGVGIESAISEKSRNHPFDGLSELTAFLSVHRMSSLFPTGITPRGDQYVNRTRVRKHSAFGSTCLSTSIVLTGSNPTGRAN